jgi:hypothetical protein
MSNSTSLMTRNGQGSFAKDVQVLAGHQHLRGRPLRRPAHHQRHRVRTVDPADARTRQSKTLSSSTSSTTSTQPSTTARCPYTTFLDRFILFLSEAFLSCNCALPGPVPGTNASYAYQFSVPPALHGSDLAYMFYNGGPIIGLGAAKALQEVDCELCAHWRPPGQSRGGSNGGVAALWSGELVAGSECHAECREGIRWTTRGVHGWQKALFLLNDASRSRSGMVHPWLHFCGGGSRNRPTSMRHCLSRSGG